jgi:exonuclease III
MGKQISNSYLNYSLNSTNLGSTKRIASKKLSGLSIYHQNIRGINNKIEELLTQWKTNQPHVLCFTEYHLTEPEITCTLIKSYNLGTYYCHKFKKNSGVSSSIKIYNSHTLIWMKLALTRKLKFVQ